MSTPVTDVPRAAPPAPSRGRRWPWVVMGIAVAGVAAFAALVASDLWVGGRSEPAFTSLAATPDPSLHGTVAYFDSDSRCVRLVAAAGQPSKDVLCIPAMDVTTAVQQGKETGPQLVWRPDGRLEVTMFRMPLTKGPGLNPGWQRIVDVRTGKVEDVPAAEVPSTADVTSRATVSPSGARISYTSNEQTGRIRVVLTDERGSRTLLSAHGPGEYTYRLSAAFWAPNYEWVAADDGRILVITTGNPAVTRVLVDAPRQVGEGEFPTFAVTGADLLRTAR